MALGIDSQHKGRGALAQLQDGALCLPVNPEVHREVAIEEDGVHRALVFYPEQLAHLVVDGLMVQLRRDDDILVAHIAWHDVFIELYAQILAVVQDAVRRCRGGKCPRADVVLHHRHLLAIHRCGIVGIGAVGRCRKGAEGVGALREEVVVRHVEVVANGTGIGQHGVAAVDGVFRIGDVGVDGVPLRVTGKAVLHTHVSQILELPVEVFQLQLQLALVSTQHLLIEYWLIDGEVDGRRRRHEVGIERHLVVDFHRLILRSEEQLDALIVQDTLVCLADGDDLLDGLAPWQEDGPSVDGVAIHENLQAQSVGLLCIEEVEAEVLSLLGGAQIGTNKGEVNRLS